MTKATSNKAPVRDPVGKNGPGPVVDGGTVKVGDKTYTRKLITLPHKKFEDGVPMRVKILAPIYKGQDQVDRKTGKPKLDEEGNPKQPVDMARCESLDTGEKHTIILGAVLKERLTENFPNEAYIGKAFEFIQHKVPDKRWRDYSITELA